MFALKRRYLGVMYLCNILVKFILYNTVFIELSLSATSTFIVFKKNQIICNLLMLGTVLRFLQAFSHLILFIVICSVFYGSTKLPRQESQV